MEPLGIENGCRWLGLFARMSSLSGSRLMACRGGKLCWPVGDLEESDDEGSCMAGNVSLGEPSEAGMAYFRRSGDRVPWKDSLRPELRRLLEAGEFRPY